MNIKFFIIFLVLPIAFLHCQNVEVNGDEISTEPSLTEVPVPVEKEPQVDGSQSITTVSAPVQVPPVNIVPASTQVAVAQSMPSVPPSQPNPVRNWIIRPGAQQRRVGVATPIHALPANANIYRVNPSVQTRQPQPHYGYWYPSSTLQRKDETAKMFTPNNGCQSPSKRQTFAENMIKNFEHWFLNESNHDIKFSVCGSVLPGHRVLLSSASTKFSEWIAEQLKSRSDDDYIILINGMTDLIGDATSGESKNSDSDECENFLKAFKMFLHHAYAGPQSFSAIQDTKTGIMARKLVQKFLDENIAEQYIDPKIIESMNQETIRSVYDMADDQQIDSLKNKWSKYIEEKSQQWINGQEALPLTCADVIDRVQILDDFLNSMNTTQAQIIKFIQHYLNNCPESIKKILNNVSSFPNSLYFYKMTIDDLKELVKMNFLKMENYAEELENRLVAKERVCEEYKKLSIPGYQGSPASNYNQMHQMEAWKQRRA